MSLDIRQPAISSVIKLTGVRKTIHQRLKFSKNEYPHSYLIILVDAKNMIQKRNELNYKPSYNAIIMKNIAEAIKKHPLLNSYMEGDEIKVLSDINISIAVDTPFGLMVPVVSNVDKKSLLEIDKEINALAEKARQNKLTLYDVTGGTITLTNLGSFGIDLFIPIINPPQTSIIGVGRINEDKKFYLTLSFNHSVVDGAEAARFLNDLKQLIEGDFTLNLF